MRNSLLQQNDYSYCLAIKVKTRKLSKAHNANSPITLTTVLCSIPGLTAAGSENEIAMRPGAAQRSPVSMR